MVLMWNDIPGSLRIFLIDAECFLLPIFALKMLASPEKGMQFSFHKCYEHIIES